MHSLRAMQASVLGVLPAYGPHAAQLAAAASSGQRLAAGYSADSDTSDADDSLAVAAGPSTRARTLHAWRQPVSPHVAVAAEGRGVADSAVQAAVAWELARFQRGVPQASRRLATKQHCMVQPHVIPPALPVYLPACPAVCLTQHARLVSEADADSEIMASSAQGAAAAALVETAGGVASPGPSGSLQASKPC